MSTSLLWIDLLRNIGTGLFVMEEIWKDIKGYEGVYQISSLGNVKTLAHYRPHSWHNSLCYYPDKILKNDIIKGYSQVKLRSNKKSQSFKVHRLVAMAFIPNTDNKPEINHKDGIKGNNNVLNLEWCTSQENSLHAIRTGLQKSGFDNPSAKINKDTLLSIRKDILEGGVPLRVIGEKYNVSGGLVSMIKFKKVWKNIK